VNITKLYLINSLKLRGGFILNLKHGTRILFQGDSITDGNRGRNEDLNHIYGHGYVYLIASRLGLDHPAKQYKFINKGISGNRVVDLYARWDEDTLQEKPDVLSILIGINDIVFEKKNKIKMSAFKYEQTYRLLIEETYKLIPHLQLVLCEPFILPVSDFKTDWSEWEDRVSEKQALLSVLAKEYRAIFVTLQAEFNRCASLTDPADWLWDGIHPTAAGHELITRKWLQCVLS
jgi:lysophospholipase L1-like esterase